MSRENNCLGLLLLAGLAALAVGCTSGGTGGIGSNSVAFDSARALDGTDAAVPNNDFNIWKVKLDGTGATPLTKLTAAGARSFDPLPSPHGPQVAFSSSRALDGSDAANTNQEDNIWVVNADGSSPTPLTKLTKAACFQPDWSPDGTKIVFRSFRALDGSDNPNTNNTNNIWVMNADGSNQKPLTMLTASGAFIDFPAWSPDGTKIAFGSRRALDGSNNSSTTTNIWLMKADGSSPTPLTKLTAAGTFTSFPAWSPDSTKIAFNSSGALDGSDAANTNSTENIWVVNADGSNIKPLTKLTASRASSTIPTWSSDGTKIAFESGRALDGSDATNAPNSTFNIWIVNADGSSPTPLTKLTASSAGSFGTVIFVAGGKIVFESDRALDGSDATNNPNNTLNIWIMNADGSSPTPLTKLTAAGASSFLRLSD